MIGHVESLDERLSAYFSREAKFEVLADGFTWTEGPLWVPPGSSVDGCDGDSGCLLFSDIPRNTIFRWRPGRGVDAFLTPSGYTGIEFYGLEPGSNGLTLDTRGRLTICEHGDRRVSVLTVGGGKRTLVDAYEGKRLNSPNDLVFDAEGNLYFTDPPYGLPDREKDARRELDHFGVYRLSVEGELTLLTTELVRPNGIGLSPDAKTLYVAQSDSQRPVWVAFAIQDDGTLGPSRELANARSYMKEFPGAPDGLTVHSSGTLLASGPGGVYVMTPDGELLGRLLTGGRVSNCALDADEKWLYITADKQLCRIPLQ
ncbi:SMP-30/gluconolactonase/LRE family protein [Aporhodopirellula aestuarii]|uniref:SMP-30/gluconolactonase/LRE family protein n=1 Tax=Aporhodopirellula aestuarii TaxID=2950107 RepID=A0ABT0U912_9BACT|nr:SMP-30/gluconolactonase/LRE family protein [Aporhodopirellula aestuarii]MCM2373179.1 SMP-30/gluconolactonase/LRE family protein [Aporhodopirellula aestuarii]